MATSLPQTLQACYDRLLRAEMAQPTPDARRELSDTRHLLHVALVDLARLNRLAAALRDRAKASPESGFAAFDAEHAENRRVKALEHALEVARDCDHTCTLIEGTIVRNDNGASL